MATPKSTKKSRVWLFAPFVGLAILFGLYFAFWQWSSGLIVTNLDAAGLKSATTKTSGFPARMSFVLAQPRYQDESLTWQTETLRLDLMPFSQQQAVLKADGPHKFKLSTGTVIIDYALNTASARVDLEGLARADAVLQEPVFSGKLGRVNLNMATLASELHLRRSPDGGETADIAITNKGIRMGRQTALDMMDLDLATPMSWFMTPGKWVSDLREGKRVALNNIHVSRQGLSIQGNGEIGSDKNDALTGQIMLQVNDLSLFLNLLQELGVINSRIEKQIEVVQGVSNFWKNLSGEKAAVKLKLNLEFRDGTSYLAKIPLGPAPRLPLPPKS